MRPYLGAAAQAVGVSLGRDYVPQNRRFNRYTLAKKPQVPTKLAAMQSGLRNLLPFAPRVKKVTTVPVASGFLSNALALAAIPWAHAALNWHFSHPPIPIPNGEVAKGTAPNENGIVEHLQK
jgi:hypothetical protein